MGRIRTVKPEFWRHEELSKLPEATHLLAASLLNYADDEGYFNANYGLIKSECSPLRDPSVSIHDSITMLCRIGFIRVGQAVDTRRYGHVLTFLDHQRINRPTKSKIAKLSITWEESPTIHPELTDCSPTDHSRKGKEGNREQGKDSSEAKASGAGAPVDLDAELFGGCLRWLASLNGNDPDKYRSVIGKWVKVHGRERTLEIFRGAQTMRKPIGDPVAWMETLLKPKLRKVPQI